jgi:probable rRNA maturation factor
MPYQVDVVVDDDIIPFIVFFRDADDLRMHTKKIVMFALKEEDAPESVVISVAYVPVAQIAALNEAYRGKNGPTDVLSFNLDDPGDDPDEDGELTLGDIIISPEIAIRQNTEYGTTFSEEIDILLIHGTLHLLGYDHVADDEAVVMESREKTIRAAWNRKE